MRENLVFKETQKFTQWWLWMLLLMPFFYLLYHFFKPILIALKTNNGTITSFSFVAPLTYWISILIGLFVVVFFLIVKMSTEISENRIVVKHLIFFKKEILLREVSKTAIITYPFYIGYGIRLSRKFGKIYNVKGNQGLLITLHNGVNYLIGTQKPEELKRFLEKFSG